MALAVTTINAEAIQQRGMVFREALSRDGDTLNLLFGQMMHDLASLFNLVTECHEILVREAELTTKHDDISPDLVDEWRNEAQGLQEDAARLTRLLGEFREATQPLRAAPDRKSQTILRLCNIWVEQTESLIDRMEDLAETLALAAHKPFRDFLGKELETVDPA